MTSNLLIFVFFVLFLLFLIESVYFLKKKLTVGPLSTANQEGDQNRGKWILIGGLILVVIIMGSFGFFFLAKQQVPSSNIALKITPTLIPTLIPSPTPNQVVYTFPTITGVLPSPTLALIATSNPTKLPTKIPSPTTAPKPKVSSPTPTIKLVIGAPASPGQGGPETITPSTGPTNTPSATSAVVIVPKMPVAGSIQNTIFAILIGISSVALGLIL